MVGPIYVSKLKKLGINTIGDLLFHLPFRYENYSLVSKINKLQPGEKVSVLGTIASFKNIFTKYGKKIQQAKIADETGEIEITWYNQPFLQRVFKNGTKVALAGEVKWFGHKLVFESPEYEILKQSTINNQQLTIHTGRLVPVYPETEGLSSKWLRSRINAILSKLSVHIPEILPPLILSKFNLMSRSEAINQIHFPKNWTEAENARRRLSFDELLTLQLVADKRKKELQKKVVGHKLEVAKYQNKLDEFIRKLPFKLTSDQEKVLSEIFLDLDRDKPMNRLLEGDVGSGKTVVAAIAMYLAYLNGLKSAVLAPTEILANQHYQTVSNILAPYGIKVGLLTSSTPHKLKTENLKFEIIVGTHALLSENIKIERLGLVVIDEQQRFGVQQRAILRDKGDNPHVLILTATPIPRTIALTLYSDLDLSVIDEMPKGRQKIKTWVVPKEKREAAYIWIETQIKKSGYRHQAFIICPFIEESESLATVKAAITEFEKLKTDIFPELKLGLLHGKLKTAAKQKVMDDFRKGKIHILVATPVVEVGIDIPNATIMMIEAADRFGLAQLHQLRGRVGRGDLQSYCLLFTEAENPKSLERLKILEKVFNGPRLAEYDLKLRGAGEIFGTSQHGHFGLKVADLTDLVLLEESKEAAHLLVTDDQSLSGVPLLKEEVEKYTIEKIAPD